MNIIADMLFGRRVDGGSVTGGRKVEGRTKGSKTGWVGRWKKNIYSLMDREYVQTNRGPLVRRERYEAARDPKNANVNLGCATWIRED